MSRTQKVAGEGRGQGARSALPIHIVETAGARDAICGERDPLPRVFVKFAAEHKYQHARCEACYTAADLAWMLAPPYVPPTQEALL